MTELLADFAFGQQYQLRRDIAHQVYIVVDSASRTVASVPVGLGGEVQTRTDVWLVQAERRRIGWALVAHTCTDRSEVGSIREVIFPNRCELRIGTDQEFHVSTNPLSGSWTISEGHLHLVRITDIARFAAGRGGRVEHGNSAGTITTLEGPKTPAPLALLILLTLEMIKADAAVPSGGSTPG